MKVKPAAAIAVLLTGFALACGGTPTAPDTPPTWLGAVIAQLQNGPVANPPLAITRYVYRGQTVYFVPQRCCDIPSVLYSDAGSVICHPDGGITGRGDGQCPDFFALRRDDHIVWRDTR